MNKNNFADLPEGWDKIFNPLKVGDQVTAQLKNYKVDGTLTNMDRTDFMGFYVVDGYIIYPDCTIRDSAILVPHNLVIKK